MIKARQRLAADTAPVPITLRDGTAAGLRPSTAGVVHGYVAVPDPGKFGITPSTAAALAAVVEEMKIRL